VPEDGRDTEPSAAFAANPGQPRATINAAWPHLLPGLGELTVMMGPGQATK